MSLINNNDKNNKNILFLEMSRFYYLQSTYYIKKYI